MISLRESDPTVPPKAGGTPPPVGGGRRGLVLRSRKQNNSERVRIFKPTGEKITS